jgi:ribonuclease VapC
MIIDSSAIISVLFDEEDASTLLQAIQESGTNRLSAASYLEVSIVIDSYRRHTISIRFDEFVFTHGIIIESVTGDHARIAREAYRVFGKGSGHPARLNFGDCFSYALAIEKNEPLLFKGDDFNHTDVRMAIPPSQ